MLIVQRSGMAAILSLMKFFAYQTERGSSPRIEIMYQLDCSVRRLPGLRLTPALMPEKPFETHLLRKFTTLTFG